MNRRRPVFWLLCALSIVLAVRASYGFVGGLSFSEGRRLARIGDYERALPLLDRSAVGELDSEARWLAAEVRLGLWQQRIEDGADPKDVASLLAAAYRDASAALASSPASGWYWMALGNLYHQAERLSLHRQGIPLGLVGQDRWTFVGRPGRIAIGMMRIGLTREPNWYPFHDQLAYVYYDYRLKSETFEAVYRSALALPVYELHAYRSLRPPDAAILDAFTRGAIDSLGKVPWLRPVVHRIALGRLEVRRENWAAAEAHLREALAMATVPLNIAEIHYYLGLSLIGQQRFDEAAEALVAAETQTLEPLAVVARAGLAEQTGHWPEAIQLWLRARRLAPRRLDVSLRLARAARRNGLGDLAVHTMREAARTHPRRHEPLAELVLIFLDQGDAAKAREAFRNLEGLDPQHPSVAVARRRLERARSSRD